MKLLNLATIICLAVPLLAIGQTKRTPSEPSMTSRRVIYHDTDIVPILTQLNNQTMVVLPKDEDILQATTGDKDYWQVNWMKNIALMKPSDPDSRRRTNVNLVCRSGNVYTLYLTDVSGDQNAHADLKVFIDPSDDNMLGAVKGKPQFVSAEELERYRNEAERAQQELKAGKLAMQKELETNKAALAYSYPLNVRTGYEWDKTSKAAKVFNVHGMFDDGKFFYIDATPQEAPAIYEVKDGKPSLIQYELRDGRYVIPKIVEDGYLKIGKAELKFHRQA